MTATAVPRYLDTSIPCLACRLSRKAEVESFALLVSLWSFLPWPGLPWPACTFQDSADTADTRRRAGGQAPYPFHAIPCHFISCHASSTVLYSTPYLTQCLPWKLDLASPFSTTISPLCTALHRTVPFPPRRPVRQSSRSASQPASLVLTCLASHLTVDPRTGQRARARGLPDL